MTIAREAGRLVVDIDVCGSFKAEVDDLLIEELGLALANTSEALEMASEVAFTLVVADVVMELVGRLTVAAGYLLLYDSEDFAITAQHSSNTPLSKYF